MPKVIIRPLEPLRTDAPEIFLPNEIASYSQNLRYYYGELRKRAGLENPKWNLGEKIQGIYLYRKFDNTIYWLALSANDLFQLNEDGTVVYRTPLYGTGTITIISQNPTIVTGSGTSFISAGIKSGHKLALSANETDPTKTWYNIQSVDSETQLTLSSPAQAYSGNYTIRKTFQAPESYRWRAIVINDNFVFTNGYNPVMKWTGSGQAEVLVSTPFFFLTGFLQRLILARIQTAEDNRPAYIQWSTTSNIGDFTGVGSGAKYFWETGKYITGIGRTTNVLVIYQDDNIFTGIPTGDPEDPFRWYLSSVGEGLIAPHSLVETKGVNFGLGRKDFFVFDGSSYIPIGREIIRFFKEKTPYNKQLETIGFIDAYDDIHFIADTKLGRLDFKYNVRFQRWSIDEFNPEITAGGLVE